MFRLKGYCIATFRGSGSSFAAIDFLTCSKQVWRSPLCGISVLPQQRVFVTSAQNELTCDHAKVRNQSNEIVSLHAPNNCLKVDWTKLSSTLELDADTVTALCSKDNHTSNLAEYSLSMLQRIQAVVEELSFGCENYIQQYSYTADDIIVTHHGCANSADVDDSILFPQRKQIFIDQSLPSYDCLKSTSVKTSLPVYSDTPAVSKAAAIVSADEADNFNRRKPFHEAHSPNVDCGRSCNYQHVCNHTEDLKLALLCQFVDQNGFANNGTLMEQILSFGRHNQLLTDKSTGEGSKNLPNPDQLHQVEGYMAENMPKLFMTSHDYNVYTNDIIFENSWYPNQSYTTVGRLMYTLEVAKLRLFVHLRLANVRVHLLKTTIQPADGSVIVRWRVSGIPQSHAILFWNFLPWSKGRSNAAEPEWLDGISVFFVNQDGLICKHRMDRVIPDDESEVAKKPSVIAKLAGMTAPTTS